MHVRFIGAHGRTFPQYLVQGRDVKESSQSQMYHPGATSTKLTRVHRRPGIPSFPTTTPPTGTQPMFWSPVCISSGVTPSSYPPISGVTPPSYPPIGVLGSPFFPSFGVLGSPFFPSFPGMAPFNPQTGVRTQFFPSYIPKPSNHEPTSSA